MSLVSEEQYKLYDLIWRRFVACQMSAAKWDVTNLDIAADTSIGKVLYKTTGRAIVFDGFTKVWSPGASAAGEQQLPVVKTGQALDAVDIKSEQHFTKPPARYTEASLVKALEKEGIGRPSTYASIISTIQDREYVEQREKKLYATDLGEVVTDKLEEYFPKVMDLAFTRYMEEQLDKIEEQHLDWVAVLNEFYGPFKKSMETATADMKHAKAETTPSKYECPKCGSAVSLSFRQEGQIPQLFQLSGMQVRLAVRQGRQNGRAESQRAQMSQLRQALGSQKRAIRPVPRMQRLSRLQDDS